LFVIKRNEQKEDVSFDKIISRLIKLSKDLKSIDAGMVAQRVINGIYPGVKTDELDVLAAETCAYLSSNHLDYGILAARLAISNLHKSTSSSILTTNKILFSNNNSSPLITPELMEIIQNNYEILQKNIDYNKDFQYDYFGFKTLQHSYLMKVNGKIVERPQHMLMRVALGIHGNNIKAVLESYDIMSKMLFTHASPTLFNAGTPNPQLSSCFLLQTKDDSIDGIYDTLKMCAKISKSAGGIGFSVHDIRAAGSYICGTNGYSNGLVPMLRVFNNTARYVDQGGAKRPGAFAVYIEPWHADIFEFLELKKNNGKEEQRARDLFYGIWIPDLFMHKVKNNEIWSLFCPNECKGLSDCWGDEFDALYYKYEKEKKFKKQVRAQDIWMAIINSQIETGGPYMLYKDACNYKSNQKNLGTIKCSNLCTEIIQWTSPNETAVCNLASIAVNKFVDKNGTFDHILLGHVVKHVVRNLDNIIDVNKYPVIEAMCSNKRHRPIGIGIQGLADLFAIMRIPFISNKAKILNKDIFETLYYYALKESCSIAKDKGSYSSFKNSPASKGILQFDMWNIQPNNYDWTTLKNDIIIFGLRNSLLLAPMPTASTSQILGNNECFEPYTSNIYSRRVLSGEFVLVNKFLQNDLIKLNIWNENIKNHIITNGGSIQNIPIIPDNIKELYKTVWEISQKDLIDMSADRGAFIDQSQSFNVFMEKPTYSKLSSLHFYAWNKGLKTGMYYLRSKPAANAIQFTVDIQPNKKQKFNHNEEENDPICNIGCTSCGS
jgi:ribonucleoside-diphosphate reductase alpha chain